tara:strand:- start:50 stop:1378 length:1329 start_codon:yes stop_codon:yes gene_type:complete
LKEKLSKIKYFLPAEKMQSNLAIFLSIFALFFAVGNSNVPCLNADTCAVGSDEVFSGTVSIQNGTNYNLQLTGSPTANRVLTLPDNTGTVALTSDIPSVPSLTASKIMATDGTGAYSTTDIYPLSVGTTGQVLTVNSLATALEYSSITGVPSLTASKSVATDGTGALTTTDVYPLTLTASKVAKTDSSGNLTTGTIDITTDITAGTSLQQIRTNAGGTALEYFTPTSGSPVTLLDSGSVSVSGDEFLICWHGTTFDPDKKYKLVLWGGDGNIGTIGYQANIKLTNNDCINNYRAEFTAEISTSGRWLGSGTASNPYTASSGVWAYSQTGFRNMGQCFPLTGNQYSTFYRPANIGGEFTFQTAGGFTTTTGDRGALMHFDMYADTFDYSQSYFMGVNTGEGFCSWQNTTNMFADITGMYGQLEGGNPHPVTNKKWSLYEVASQ